MNTRMVTSIASTLLMACGGNGGTVAEQQGATPAPTLADITPAQWEALSRRRIFFGHQSVGGNIMDGVTDVLRDNPQMRLALHETRDLRASASPGFFHALIGRNDFPLEKFDDFVELASSGFDASGGIAMMKLCYVDIHRQTNADSLFREYQVRVQRIRMANPSVTIVHVTAPLTGIENWKGQLRAMLSGRATERQRNVVRNRYNDLMRTTYGDREPIFDLARLESTLPDGSRAFFGGDQPVYMLAPEYTDDGGHLNATARRRIAEQLLIMLARLPQSDSEAGRAASAP